VILPRQNEKNIKEDLTRSCGTAAIFAEEHDVFTLSIHQTNNYPAVKPPSTLDVELPDGTGDDAYLRALEPALDAVVASGPRLAFYLAGADPYRDDQLGGLSLSFDGLRRRDAVVLSALRAAGAAVVVTLAGGYARRVDDTVAIHVATIEEAFAIAQNAL
jgi:acetoin utilization deacetylase AcuC-like enzyme